MMAISSTTRSTDKEPRITDDVAENNIWNFLSGEKSLAQMIVITIIVITVLGTLFFFISACCNLKWSGSFKQSIKKLYGSVRSKSERSLSELELRDLPTSRPLHYV